MPGITRRRLLEESLLAATAAALAADRAALGRAREPGSSGRKAGANDTIRIACLGVHGRGVSHVEAYSAMRDVAVAAICDIDANVVGPAMEVVEKRGQPRPAFVQDLRRILDDPSIDAVSIATCNHWHSLAAIWAMQSGKDVYVEKPVSHNVWEGRQLVEAARKQRRICQAGTQIRSAAGSREAVEYVHSGGIGKVTLARGLCYKPRGSIGHKVDAPVPAGVDYDLWLGPAPKRPFNPNRFHYQWHWNWDYGNGDLGNQGIHQMDVARWGLNRPGLPKSALALGGRFGYQDDGQTPNTQLVFLDYGECELIFEVRGLRTDGLRVKASDPEGVRIGNILYGSEGYVVLTDYNGGAAFDRDGKLVRTFRGGGDHFRNFIDAMRSRRPGDLRGEIVEGHVSSALCHLANISYRVGSEQPFSSKTERFGDDREAYETFARFEQHLTDNGIRLRETSYRVGRKLSIDAGRENFGEDREANALLTRDYRHPFVVPKIA